MRSDELRQLIEAGYHAIGELEFAESLEGYRLYHRVDRHFLSKAKVLRSPEDAREVAKYNVSGAYRPLKGAPNFYPAAVGIWRAFREKDATAVSLRQTLNRQTGMYRIAQKLTTEQAKNLVQKFCSSDGRCLRTILWGIEPNQHPAFLPPSKSDPSVDQTGEGRMAIPFLCLEACNLLVGAARKVVVSHAKKKASKND
jgi:hypothetical protein